MQIQIKPAAVGAGVCVRDKTFWSFGRLEGVLIAPDRPFPTDSATNFSILLWFLNSSLPCGDLSSNLMSMTQLSTGPFRVTPMRSMPQLLSVSELYRWLHFLVIKLVLSPPSLLCWMKRALVGGFALAYGVQRSVTCVLAQVLGFPTITCLSLGHCDNGNAFCLIEFSLVLLQKTSHWPRCTRGHQACYMHILSNRV